MQILVFSIEYAHIIIMYMEQSITEERQIKRMRTKKEKEVEALPIAKREKIEGLIDAIEGAGLDEFMEYIRSPWKMLWPNFVA